MVSPFVGYIDQFSYTLIAKMQNSKMSFRIGLIFGIWDLDTSFNASSNFGAILLGQFFMMPSRPSQPPKGKRSNGSATNFASRSTQKGMQNRETCQTKKQTAAKVPKT